MCRIYGHFGGHVPDDRLRAVARLQRHGGPDAQTHHSSETWALGNNRLAIVDLDHGEQPYSLGDAIHVVFNGEIYNHRELRERLRGFGYSFDDDCDGSILPALYHRYGTDFPEHLDGMFAVALVDLRSEPKLVLATDEAGMKPLYYHEDASAGTLSFSSELPALLSMPGIDRSVWTEGLDSYLSTKTPFGERTMFAELRVLPRAATAEFTERSGLRVHRRTPAPGDVETGDLHQAGERLRELLSREVGRLRLGDVPVSAITSGGLDSSLVTALLAPGVPDLHSFNIAYKGDWPFDEREYARAVAEYAGTNYHQVESDPADFPELLDQVVWHLGQPNADPITISTYVLFRAVHEAGFKVAVTGDAADEIFGGYGRMRQALRDGADWADRYVESLAAVPRGLRERLYSAEYRDHLRQQGTVSDRIKRDLLADGRSRLDAITELEVDERLPAYHLRRVDHLSMASSVEVRLPFCQPEVTRLARGLPQDLRIRGDEGKRVLYAAANGQLPDSVLNRSKQPFTLPITTMLTEGNELLEFARQTLSPGEIAGDGRLDPRAVTELIDRQAAQPSDETALAVWSLMIHQVWAERMGVGTGAHRELVEGAV
ncbi:asparagine synthetase B [Actinopolyspora erythraea]|uniref:asparagine synthase (glutamine-hydrolyzing) n=1 Tax=Actinopolyspora erythraea TaxID=414996 RepID=A0A099D9H3_9ACTN|nr:asparagine synthase (glutamine-hydrolyzing) [Actinopolyspora erythraea]ASU81336.1 asparagine synthetase B [Actinopolyspora erythraea]KGI82521.1 asparagine synthase [Actinopolyspora erythraea]